jgi:hypothetical protein
MQVHMQLRSPSLAPTRRSSRTPPEQDSQQELSPDYDGRPPFTSSTAPVM